MGGFGAISYAARHPDRFTAAASFSGAVDTNDPADIAITGDEPFGPRATQEVRWRGHNPWDLAANLRGLSLTVRTGNGLPGGPFGGGDGVEQVVHRMSVASTGGCGRSASATSSTTTAPAATRGPTGSATCARRSRASWRASPTRRPRRPG